MNIACFTSYFYDPWVNCSENADKKKNCSENVLNEVEKGKFRGQNDPTCII